MREFRCKFLAPLCSFACLVDINFLSFSCRLCVRPGQLGLFSLFVCVIGGAQGDKEGEQRKHDIQWMWSFLDSGRARHHSILVLSALNWRVIPRTRCKIEVYPYTDLRKHI
jgi:hypothetical protein